MRQRIARHEQTLRDPSTPIGTAALIRVKLFFRYIQYAVVHAFTLLFMHPTKSFVAIYDPRPDGVWQRSYVEHIAYRNQVRFASVSGLGVLVTAAVATYAIFGLVFPDKGISPVYASTLTVNSNNDISDGACTAGHCSLREAIAAANSGAGADTITFSGAMTIQVTSALPQLTDNSTTLNGAGTVTLDGTSAGSSVSGLLVASDSNLIEGLIITNFNGSGIELTAAADNNTLGGTGASQSNYIFSNDEDGISINGSNNLVSVNYIGEQTDGSADVNLSRGVRLESGTGNQVGVSTAHSYTGSIYIGSGASDTTVLGAVIGETSTGATSTALTCVTVEGTNTTIGGTGSGEPVYCVNSQSSGIETFTGSDTVNISGNFVGMDENGVSGSIGSDGILVRGTPNLTISGNYVVNSELTGIYIDTVSSGTNVISNNVVGMLPSGVAAGNTFGGIYLLSSTGVTVQNNQSGNNHKNGLTVDSSTASVTGNYFGIDANGTLQPNLENGILMMGTVTGTSIGGSAENRNYISGNARDGMSFDGTVTGDPIISYNYIGLDADGATNKGNTLAGVSLSVGNLTQISHNVVSFNGSYGFEITGSSNTLTSNVIGLTVDGDQAPNGSNGVYLSSTADSNTIGQVGSPNVIAGNSDVQLVAGSGADANQIVGNYFNCDVSCVTNIDAGYAGLALQGATNTVVTDNYFGGGGSGDAVTLELGTADTQFTGNGVGVGTDGGDISGESNAGVSVSDSDSDQQTIGSPDSGNTIKNFVVGVSVDESQQVTIRGNSIYSNSEAALTLLNGANADVSAPVILNVQATEVIGTSQANATIDVYQDSVGEQMEMYQGSTQADANGDWSLVGTFDVDQATTATSTDASGNTSDLFVYTTDPFAPSSSASPAGGTYSGTQTVTLTATDNSDPSPRIFFTVDGSTPTLQSTEYSSPLTVAGDTSLKFFAVDSLNNQEEVNTEVYNITQDQSGTFAPNKIGILLGSGVVHPTCDTCTIRTSDTTPTFIGHVKHSLVDYIIRLVIFAVSNTDSGTAELQKVFTKQKQIKVDPNDASLGIWKITVPDQKALSLGEYIVKLGLKDADGNTVTPVNKGLSLAVTPPAPVALSPRHLVYTKTPEFIGNALNGTTVIARVKKDGVELAHCSVAVTSSSTGTGDYACHLPFDLPAGEYVSSVSTQDPVSSMISDGSETPFTISSPVPLTDNLPISLVPGAATITGQFMTTDNTPVFIGLAPNDTEVVIVIDGTRLFSATLTNNSSGTGHWTATTSYLEEGVHTVYAMVRSGGLEQSRTSTLTFKIVAPTVVPLIIAPLNGAYFATGTSLSVVVLGHKTDTITLTLNGLTTISVTGRVDSDRAVFTFDHGLPRGSWTATAVATDVSGKQSVHSAPVTFTEHIPLPQPVDTNTNVNVDTGTTGNENVNADTNGNENVNENINVNGDTNTNSNENTNLNTNENTNSDTNSNTNTNENVNVGTNENVNTPPTTTQPDQTPLPPLTPVFTFPEGVEKFPIYTKTPDKFTSDQENAVHVVLTDYLKKQLQILPAVEEGNSNYLITKTTADNQPILTSSQSVGLGGSTQLTSAVNALRRLFSLAEFKQTTDVLIFRGTTIPYATVQLTIFSDPIVKIAQADQDGRWTMTVPASSLPAGDHTAYLKTSYAGASSDEVQIARFVVIQQEHLSNTTWLFIINLAVILVILLAAIFLQLRKRTQLLVAQKTPLPNQAPWKSGSVATPKADDQNNKKPKGPNDLGDVMGV